MKDEFASGDGLGHRHRIVQVALNQLNLRRDVSQILTATRAEIIKDPDAITPLQEGCDDMRTDETRAAGDEA